MTEPEKPAIQPSDTKANIAPPAPEPSRHQFHQPPLLTRPEGRSDIVAVANRQSPSKSGLKSKSKAPAQVDVPLPASQYKIYSSHDITGTFPSSYELVLDIAARWVGIGREDLNAVAETFEKRAVSWWKSEKRRRQDKARSDTGEGAQGNSSEVDDGASERIVDEAYD